jgi:hypothetical protein
MASDIVAQLRGYGFNVYEITNNYGASSYVKAMDEPQRPQRIFSDIDPDKTADLVFSRIDAPHL